MANPDQFTSLYTKHERQLYRFLASMLGQPAEAEDLLRETAKSCGVNLRVTMRESRARLRASDRSGAI